MSDYTNMQLLYYAMLISFGTPRIMFPPVVWEDNVILFSKLHVIEYNLSAQTITTLLIPTDTGIEMKFGKYSLKTKTVRISYYLSTASICLLCSLCSSKSYCKWQNKVVKYSNLCKLDFRILLCRVTRVHFWLII